MLTISILVGTNILTSSSQPHSQGSCWSFSTIGAFEGINQIVTGELIALSEQQLVDCDHFDAGCNGGLMDNAFQYIIKNGGIDTKADYGYTAKDGKCDTHKVFRIFVAYQRSALQKMSCGITMLSLQIRSPSDVQPNKNPLKEIVSKTYAHLKDTLHKPIKYLFTTIWCIFKLIYLGLFGFVRLPDKTPLRSRFKNCGFMSCG